MIISPVQTNEPTFGYRSPLKTLWRQGKLPSVKYGFYGDILTQKNVTLEHLRPKSKRGKTELCNLVLATEENNLKRGSKPIANYLYWDNVERYLNQFKDINVEGFIGNQYIKAIMRTLNKLLKEQV